MGRWGNYERVACYYPSVYYIYIYRRTRGTEHQVSEKSKEIFLRARVRLVIGQTASPDKNRVTTWNRNKRLLSVKLTNVNLNLKIISRLAKSW